MTHGSNFWVIGGEFGSMNFHKLVEGSAGALYGFSSIPVGYHGGREGRWSI